MLRIFELAPRLSRQVSRASFAFVFIPALFSLGCGGVSGSEPQSEQVGETTQALTPDAVSICNQDPRVWLNMVPLAVCAGARVFFDETFDGNGRKCGTCHPPANNFTIDRPFVESL